MCVAFVGVKKRTRQVFTGFSFLPLPSFLLFQIPTLKEELHDSFSRDL